MNVGWAAKASTIDSGYADFVRGAHCQVRGLAPQPCANSCICRPTYARLSGGAAKAPGERRIGFLGAGFAESNPGVKQASLGSRGGDAQFAGGFPDGAFLQLANFDGS